MPINLKDTIVINKQLNEAWIKKLDIGGLPNGQYMAQVYLCPWNRETNQFEENVSLEQHPDMAFSFDVMQRLQTSQKLQAAYAAIIEAVNEAHQEVIAAIEARNEQQ